MSYDLDDEVRQRTAGRNHDQIIDLLTAVAYKGSQYRLGCIVLSMIAFAELAIIVLLVCQR